MTMEIAGNSLIPPQWMTPPAMTDEQKATVQSILQDYAGKELTEDSAQSILERFREADIAPGAELKTIMADAGFDAEGIADLAGIPPSPQGPGGPPTGGQGGPPPGNNVGQPGGLNQEALQTLQDILSGYPDLNDLTDQEESELNAALMDAGLLEPGALISANS